jgi:nucleotide-binding universal stress UspA family protein
LSFIITKYDKGHKLKYSKEIHLLFINNIMNTVLAATDYSKNSLIAINYAAALAKSKNAKLILLHVFHPPVIISEVPIAIPSIKEMTEANDKELKKISNRLKIKFGSKLKIEYKSKCGLIIDEIKDVVKKNNISLVVMGMHGAGIINEKLIGSITTSLIQKANCPILVISKKSDYKAPKKIVLATDYNELKNKKTIKKFKEFVNQFKSRVTVLNVFTDKQTQPTLNEAVSSKQLDKALKGINYKVDYIKNNNVINGINKYVKQNNIDMVAMISRKHSIFKRLVSEPNTKQMAFHGKAPLFVIHEE